LTCATVIASDADYADNLASATSSLDASGTNYMTTFAPGKEEAAPSATAESSASEAASSAGSAAASATGDSGAASTMIGIGAIGGAVLLLATWL
jgi:hypothetical protein